VASRTGDRSEYFPAIEAKHGEPVAFWLAALAALGDVRYEDQIAFLRDRHGFSRTHANAVVMYARGSTTSRRFADPEALLADLGGEREVTARAILGAITSAYPDLELVVAWNQPMLRKGKQYVFGLSAAKNHLLLGPLGEGVMEAFADRFADLGTNKKTVKVPIGWEVDADLLRDLVRYRLDEIERG